MRANIPLGRSVIPVSIAPVGASHQVLPVRFSAPRVLGLSTPQPMLPIPSSLPLKQRGASQSFTVTNVYST